ncbi:MAG: type II toxin-antitoxin system RelE/ParE family toxin [Thermodesulfobacteriota bacterium]|nr:type II toxin-antitoxin system RelE/ParE family toxin [Thermodesulfobacteriota bacterium]
MQIRWLTLAAQDLEQAEAYIAQENPTSAVQVVLRIIEAVELLADQPGIGRPGRLEGTRELVVDGTPFIVPYRKKDACIEILRVYHQSRCWPDTL